jgi:alkanesulfonate monooxygenase SsuD/methylene tetrahydromethanopterin reductase-like flavin-dependent oxidoreductase (luciferase family)
MIEGQEDVTWDDWRALAAACEEHGIEAMFRSDHYLSVSGHDERGSLDAWTTLAALAAVTTKLRLGTLVSPATFRHPAVLAKSAVTVDHVSGGRAELGIGTGWLEAEHTVYGFDFPPLARRVDELARQLETIAAHWAEDSPQRPKPVQRPSPPLILGGHGGPRSLALAARWADEYNTVYKTLDQLREIRRGLDQACQAAGREPIPLSLMTGWLVGADRADYDDRASRLAEWTGEEVAKPPASWIAGTLDDARERLSALEAAGVARVMAQHLLHRDREAIALLAQA